MNQKNSSASSNDIFEQGLQKSLDLLHRCSTSHGFLASTVDRANYKRIWGRDGSIIGLAALLSGDHDLIKACKKTLQTLAKYQGPHGEIPSNVDPMSDRVSYGGMAGRVDADLWFVICCGEYWLATGDDDFLEEMFPILEKIFFLLGAWEFNSRGLLYIPQTGDWADEYLHHGYVLYDQLLYLQVQRTRLKIHKYIYESTDHKRLEEMSHLKHLIRANYWFQDEGRIPDEVYHEILYKKGYKATWYCNGNYWMPYFSPQGYGYRFDSFANVLISLLDIADDFERQRVDNYIKNEIVQDGFSLLPAFYPVITPIDDEDWKELKTTFSYSFKNNPYEYHNGGLWPMITGFYVADLVKRSEKESAKQFLRCIHEANALKMDEEEWSFPEYVHGQKFTAEGTKHQGWSAAGAIIGHYALEGKELFRSDKNE